METTVHHMLNVMKPVKANIEELDSIKSALLRKTTWWFQVETLNINNLYMRFWIPNSSLCATLKFKDYFELVDFIFLYSILRGGCFIQLQSTNIRMNHWIRKKLMEKTGGCKLRNYRKVYGILDLQPYEERLDKMLYGVQYEDKKSNS